MTFYLFRHGETYYSKNNLLYGKQIESAKIIPEGVSQIKDIAVKLDKEGVKVIYSSPIKRCVQTVKIIKDNVPAMEIVYCQGLEEEKISRGLESLKDLTERIIVFLNEIESSGLKKVGVCTHGWPMAVIIALLQKGNVQEIDLANYPKCAELVVTKTDQAKPGKDCKFD